MQIFASRTTRLHFSSSALMKTANASGGMPPGFPAIGGKPLTHIGQQQRAGNPGMHPIDHLA